MKADEITRLATYIHANCGGDAHEIELCITNYYKRIAHKSLKEAQELILDGIHIIKGVNSSYSFKDIETDYLERGLPRDTDIKL